MLDLNNPQTRQKVLRDRLDLGTPLVAAALAEELGISVDTIRRDLIAMEQTGLVRRVRGGAIPVTRSTPPYAARAETPDPGIARLAAKAVTLVPSEATLFLDAGTTMNAIAARLPEDFSGLVVTPAPSVALAALNRGARVQLIGGELCPEGAMATGGAAERAVGEFAADLCLLGACGLWPDFGLSAEDGAEAGIKRAMAMASARAIVVTTSAKLERRGRHRVLELNEIDGLVTNGPSGKLDVFRAAGVEVTRV
ncbi:DeoR/GlpR family DNA-binding transcription regulator [Roseibium sp. Sym1]|uniref:DeoR/GlpR family DNA-binding transcription regulator n=1 Tax=Roseibium sp. Sym1 TaxID=3016006 RepID=UPI0022B53446|nr:DeoR/GlpR family DNA-binding transcription regulator [Roseibium sp. Sym1]